MGRGCKTKPETLQHAIQRLEKIRAQRDELQKALEWINRRCPAEFINQEPHRVHLEAAYDAGACARAAIAKVAEASS